MRRQIFITLVLLGVVALAALQLTGNLSGRRMRVMYGTYASPILPLSPPTAPNTASLQTSLDRISRTALDGQWAAAVHEVHRLEAPVRTIGADSSGSLQIEQAISRGIEALHVRALPGTHRVCWRQRKNSRDILASCGRDEITKGSGKHSPFTLTLLFWLRPFLALHLLAILLLLVLLLPA